MTVGFVQPPYWATERHWRRPPQHVALRLITPPVAEPITLAQAKSILKVTIADDDLDIASYITSARVVAENWTNRALPPQTWDFLFDQLPAPWHWLNLPLTPLLSVTSITAIDIDGVPSVLDPATYLIDADSEPPRIGLPTGLVWPMNMRAFQPVAVRAVVGYAGKPVPIATLTQVANLATAVTVNPHGLTTGKVVTISGATPSAYNGTFAITVPDTTSFTFPVLGLPGPASGVLVATPSAVPEDILQAMRLLIAHFYENRVASAVGIRFDATLPLGVEEWLNPYLVDTVA